MMAEHISYIPGENGDGAYHALSHRIDANHVRKGRWTQEEYADIRRYRAEVTELGFDTADALVWSTERDRFAVYAEQNDGHGRISARTLDIPNGQLAIVIAAWWARRRFTTDIERFRT